MRDEAADAGRYESKLWHDKDYPKVQILTIEGLLNNTERVDAPTQMNPFGSSPNRIPGAQPSSRVDFVNGVHAFCSCSVGAVAVSERSALMR